MTGIFSRETIPVWAMTALSVINLATIIIASPNSREDFFFIGVGLFHLHFQAFLNGYRVKELNPDDKKKLLFTFLVAGVVSVASLFYLSTETPTALISMVLCFVMAIFPAAVGEILFRKRSITDRT